LNPEKEKILIQKLREGDRKAFEEIVNHYKNMVFSISLKIVNNSFDAEEIAMDVFLKAFDKISSFNGDSGFSTWIYRIAYNMSISHVRKKKLELEDIDSHGYRIQDESSKNPLELILQSEDSSKINKAFSRLDEIEQQLLTLSYLEKKKNKEVAQILNMSESNVKVKIHRIKIKLAGLLKQEGHALNL
jgi:RNA polymerase sigma-70 factor (ECF subfamily)